LLEQYHVSDPVTFYNVRDKWTVPADPNAISGDQPPYYVLADAPGGNGSSPQFQLTTPMMVNNSPNLAAFISANSDPGPDYGKITVRVITNNSAIQGPQQIANVFKTNTQISKDISLLDQGQSSIIHGNLLTLPVGGTFLYVEPLYVQSSYPTLQRVLVSYGDRIGYGATLQDALSDLKPGHTTGETLTTTGGNGSQTQPTTTPSPSGSSSPGSTPSPSPTGAAAQRAMLAQLNAAFADLQAASKSGDVSAAAVAQGRVLKLLQQYLAAYGPPPSGSRASPSPLPSK
jgi:uncharacterized membrane protein (UPF0182 family)